MTEQDREFRYLVETWNKMRGTGKGYEDGVRKLVKGVIDRVAALDALTDKPTEWGPLATPTGFPLTWEEFRASQVRPHLERLQALLEHVDEGRPFTRGAPDGGSTPSARN